jgi:hypothetical protein
MVASALFLFPNLSDMTTNTTHQMRHFLESLLLFCLFLLPMFMEAL